MPLSQTWVETDPDGSVITGSLLDNWIRFTKIAVRERLEDATSDLVGLLEVGSWVNAPKPKKGSARVFVTTEALLAGLPLEDGRIAVTTDTNRIYHLSTAGVFEVGPDAFSGAFTGNIAADTFSTDNNDAAPTNGRFLARESATYNYGYQLENRNALRRWGLAVDVVVDDGKFALVDITAAAARMVIDTAGLATFTQLASTGAILANGGITVAAGMAIAAAATSAGIGTSGNRFGTIYGLTGDFRDTLQVGDGLGVTYGNINALHSPYLAFSRGGAVKGYIGTSDNGDLITGQSADSIDIRSNTGRINFATALGTLAAHLVAKRLVADGTYSNNATANGTMAAGPPRVLTFDLLQSNVQYYPIAIPAATQLKFDNAFDTGKWIIEVSNPGGFVLSIHASTPVTWLGQAFPTGALTAGKKFTMALYALGTTLTGQWSQEP